MKRIFVIIAIFSFLVISSSAQETLSLQKAFDMARQNYPLINQKDLIRKTESISVENLQKGFLPQFSLSGQATYQSDVTKVSIPVPGFSIEPPSKDQYKIMADISQLIYDGGITKEQKELQKLSASVEEQKVEVELYKLKERINQLFLSILYLDEQKRQVDLVKDDIQTGIKRVEAQVANGVAFRSNLNMLKAELLKVQQRLIEVKSSRKGLAEALSLFISKEINESTVFEKPFSETIIAKPDVTRPELKLFADQDKLLRQQEKLITAKNLPKASLFAQGGYGRPALNLLKNEFDFYYIGGVRFTQRKKRKSKLR